LNLALKGECEQIIQGNGRDQSPPRRAHARSGIPKYLARDV
jgi:hypothetical protein